MGFSAPWRRCNGSGCRSGPEFEHVSPASSFCPLRNSIAIENGSATPFRNAQALENLPNVLAFNPRFRLPNGLLSNRPLEYGVFDLSRKLGTVQRELFGLPPKTTNPQEVGP